RSSCPRSAGASPSSAIPLAISSSWPRCSPEPSPLQSEGVIAMKTWFITGASRGFGALVVERALAKGDAVVATARNPQVVIDRFGPQPNLLAIALDVTDQAQAIAA